MFEYFQQKLEEEEEKIERDHKMSNPNSIKIIKKPKYKGPIPRPNRFNILPGYRWDGVDRGNGFETKLLTRSNDRAALKEDEYRWATSDM